MSDLANMGFISVLPAVIAIVLSFVTKNTIVSLVIACITGTLLAGEGLLGFPNLLKSSLGTPDFAWVMLLNTFIGILVAYFQKTGAIQSFSQTIHNRNLSRKGAQLMAWVLGIFIYFSDSFSPLFVGSVMRSITDKAKVSREETGLYRRLHFRSRKRPYADHRMGRLPDGTGCGNRLHRHAGRCFQPVPQSHPL